LFSVAGLNEQTEGDAMPGRGGGAAGFEFVVVLMELSEDEKMRDILSQNIGVDCVQIMSLGGDFSKAW
jgi:hypothetical protein